MGRSRPVSTSFRSKRRDSRLAQIGGAYALDDKPVDAAHVAPLAGPQCHTWADGPIGLAASDDEPLLHEATGCRLVFDGRIDNRADLERELPHALGASDGQLVLAAYVEWGREAIGRLLGDFALGVWDPRSRCLLVARDPVGIRPLFIARAQQGILFATTLEPLLTAPGVDAEVDDAAATAYLYSPLFTLRRSMLRGVEPLFGGERGEIREGRLRIDRYWYWPDRPPDTRRMTTGDEEEFRYLLTDAVRCRLDSVGQVGLMLSGGLDSTSIAALAGWLQAGGEVEPLRTYSATFERFVACDERPYIGPSSTATDSSTAGSTETPAGRSPTWTAGPASRSRTSGHTTRCSCADSS